MEWRCEACGKPHEENAPPCGNCGHGRFERTTVPAAEDAGPEQLEWVCTECGRSHPRNSPPCSRCGNTKLERQELEYDLDDLDVDGYLDMASPGYVLLAAVAVGFAVVLALGVTGVVDLPAALGGQPGVSDVPGQADTAANLSLSDVETEYVAAVNARRDGLQRDAVARDDALDDAATYLNQRYVKAAYADGEEPDLARDDLDAFDVRCPGTVGLAVHTLGSGDGGVLRALESYSESGLAEAVATAHSADAAVLAAATASVGVDVHVAPDDVLYVTTLVCSE